MSARFSPFMNAAEAEFCLRCRRPLNLRALIESEEKERELLRLMTPEMIEQMIQKRVETRYWRITCRKFRPKLNL